jgi:hypothetical protein
MGNAAKEPTMAGIPRNKGRADPKVGPSDSSDTLSDRPNQTTDTDAAGTGERPTVGKLRPPPSEASTDRVVNESEAGLGEGLDQAEEAKLGVTDEELRDKAAEAESDLVKTPEPESAKVGNVKKRRRFRKPRP